MCSAAFTQLRHSGDKFEKQQSKGNVWLGVWLKKCPEFKAPILPKQQQKELRNMFHKLRPKIQTH
jgi:hypothetical protein